MSTLFDYVPHSHLERRKAAGPPKVISAVSQVHGQSRMGKLNAKIGLKITVIVGTMWAAYLFAAIALISFKDNLKSTQTLILWVSSSFLQLVLLPIIIVGQNVQAAAADTRSQATYDDAVAILEEARQIQAHLEAQDAHLERILTSVSH